MSARTWCTAITACALSPSSRQPSTHCWYRPAAPAFLVERWADEAAAEVVGSRRQAAAALARVALTTSPARLAPGALAFHREAVVERVLALQAPRAPSRKSMAVLTLGLAGLTALCEADATLAFGRLTGRLLGW